MNFKLYCTAQSYIDLRLNSKQSELMSEMETRISLESDKKIENSKSSIMIEFNETKEQTAKVLEDMNKVVRLYN